ncbi:MAG: response regulator [Planctomycetota bacterium]|nr:response regulator [Planctomycetota bacterium]
MPAPKKAKKAVKSRRADTADGAEEAPIAAVPQSPPEPPRSLRVLLVDDDAEIIESMRTVLESKGYEILVARDGNQGLLMAERENPDLVVLDMMMPKRSGFLVLERLRRSHPVPMRVIMITANEGSRHRAYAEMLGVDDYIRKPFAMDRLLDSVQRLIGAAR